MEYVAAAKEVIEAIDTTLQFYEKHNTRPTKPCPACRIERPTQKVQDPWLQSIQKLDEKESQRHLWYIGF